MIRYRVTLLDEDGVRYKIVVEADTLMGVVPNIVGKHKGREVVAIKEIKDRGNQ